jgi:hypothetical protein
MEGQAREASQQVGPSPHWFRDLIGSRSYPWTQILQSGLTETSIDTYYNMIISLYYCVPLLLCTQILSVSLVPSLKVLHSVRIFFSWLLPQPTSVALNAMNWAATQRLGEKPLWFALFMPFFFPFFFYYQKI